MFICGSGAFSLVLSLATIFPPRFVQDSIFRIEHPSRNSGVFTTPLRYFAGGIVQGAIDFIHDILRQFLALNESLELIVGYQAGQA